MDIHRNRRGQSVVAAKKAGKQNRNCEEDASPTRQSTVSQPQSHAQIVRTQSADAANGLLRSARSCDFIRIADAISGLPRPCRGLQLRFRPVPAAKKKQPLKNQRLFSLSVIRKDQFSLHSDVVQVQVVVVVMLS